jgi:hypothetical protein
MIELRWLVTPADPQTFTDEKRVLQYRVPEPNIADWSKWGPWRDVPSVAFAQ